MNDETLSSIQNYVNTYRLLDTVAVLIMRELEDGIKDEPGYRREMLKRTIILVSAYQEHSMRKAGEVLFDGKTFQIDDSTEDFGEDTPSDSDPSD